MLPEVAEFFNEMDQAHEKVNSKSGISYAEWKREQRKAWDKLADSTDTPLVGWIAENCNIRRNFQEQAFAILKVLPATIKELDEIARNREWCEVYEEFKTEAIRAGVVPTEHQIEMRINGSDWSPMNAQPGWNTVFPKKMVDEIFLHKVTEFTVIVGTTIVSYRKVAP